MKTNIGVFLGLTSLLTSSCVTREFKNTTDSNVQFTVMRDVDNTSFLPILMASKKISVRIEIPELVNQPECVKKPETVFSPV